MAEYIDRDEAINRVFEAFADGRSAYIALETIPAADVRPVVRGKWEEKEKDGVWWCACSVCGEHIPKGRWGQEWYSLYCPNCGADMREES